LGRKELVVSEREEHFPETDYFLLYIAHRELLNRLGVLRVVHGAVLLNRLGLADLVGHLPFLAEKLAERVVEVFVHEAHEGGRHERCLEVKQPYHPLLGVV